MDAKTCLALPKGKNPKDHKSWIVVVERDGRYFEPNNLNSYPRDHYDQVHPRDVKEIIFVQQSEIRELRTHLPPHVLTEHMKLYGNHLKDFDFDNAQKPLIEMMKCLDIFKASLDGEHSLSCGDDLKNQNQLWMHYQQLKNLGY